MSRRRGRNSRKVNLHFTRNNKHNGKGVAVYRKRDKLAGREYNQFLDAMFKTHRDPE